MESTNTKSAMQGVDEVERTVLEILSQNASGLDDTQLRSILKQQSRISGVTVPDQLRIDALNSLVGKSRVQVLQKGGPSGVAFFRFVPEDQAHKLKDLSMEEQLVFQTINDAGSAGALESQFKFVINQPQKRVNAILKKLERQGLIKSVKSVDKGNRKVWLLMEVEPDQKVTGGLTGAQGFDLEKIQVVCDKVVAHSRKQGRVSHRELLVYIKQMGILDPEQLTDENINQVIASLVYDLKLEVIMDASFGGNGGDSGSIYKAANWSYPGSQLDELMDFQVDQTPQVAYTETPCAHCKLKKECGPTNKINPQQCEYMQEWLELF